MPELVPLVRQDKGQAVQFPPASKQAPTFGLMLVLQPPTPHFQDSTRRACTYPCATYTPIPTHTPNFSSRTRANIDGKGHLHKRRRAHKHPAPHNPPPGPNLCGRFGQLCWRPGRWPGPAKNSVGHVDRTWFRALRAQGHYPRARRRSDLAPHRRWSTRHVEFVFKARHVREHQRRGQIAMSDSSSKPEPEP